MILESIRMVADALADAGNGVNAQLEALEDEGLLMDEGDERPPAIVAVLDETRNEQVGRHEAPADWPVLIVTLDVPAETDGEPSPTGARRRGRVAIAVRYASNAVSSAQRRAHMYATLRAIVRTIDWLTHPSQRETVATRNGISLVSKDSVFFGSVDQYDEEERLLVGGAVVATFLAQDSNL